MKAACYKARGSTITMPASIDPSDQYYGFIHKSVKWWQKAMFQAMEVGTVSSYVVYKIMTGNRISNLELT